MPLQNRVLPTGEIVSIRARGTLTGNRGIIHRNDRTLGTSRWSHHAWICCTLDWQGRKRAVMTGRNWTELFFLDEATAFAAGHRPCGYCRRTAYKRYVAAWERVTGARPTAKAMDRALHAARVRRDRTQICFDAPFNTLPNGAFVFWNKAPHLVWRGQLYPYQTEGYGNPCSAHIDAIVSVLTPMPTIAVLRAGYVPQVQVT